MANDDMTPGEIARALHRIEGVLMGHGEKLDEVKEQTFHTNGFVGRHEERLLVTDREIKGLKANHERVVWAIFGLVLSIIGGIAVAVITR